MNNDTYICEHINSIIQGDDLGDIIIERCEEYGVIPIEGKWYCFKHAREIVLEEFVIFGGQDLGISGISLSSDASSSKGKT